MTPEPLQLRRRRWTLVFTFPFTVCIAIVGAYSVFLLFSDDILLKLVGGVSAFVAFCVGGTLGKSVLEAWRNNDPAVVIDRHGLNDLRGGAGLVCWHDIETVKLDLDEQSILVNFARHAASKGHMTSKTRRLFTGADCTIALGGLSYSHIELARSLAEHHRQAKVGDIDKVSAHDGG